MTERDEFDDPTSGVFVPVKDMVGHLVLFYPLRHEEGFSTQFGEKDVIFTDAHDLTDGVVYQNASVLQGALIGVLKRNVGTGRAVFGTIAKGEAKKGQAAPYILVAGTDEEKAKARKYIASQKDEFSV